MPKKLIATCIPTLGLVDVHWANNFALLSYPMNISTLRLYRIGMLVAEARNSCVQDCFNKEKEQGDVELTHILWIDDDVIVHPAALQQLISHETPIVSGVYFSKDDYSKPLMFPGLSGGTLPFIPDRYEPIWGHGMGLTLIEAQVYKRMKEEMDLGVDSNGNPQWYCTYDRALVKKEGGSVECISMTEDLYFLDHAHKLGYQPMIDTSARAFGWHFNIKTRTGYPKKQWDEFMTKGTVTWDTPDGPVTWTDWR